MMKMFEFFFRLIKKLSNPSLLLINHIMRRKFYVKDSNNKRIFSVRMMGGNTYGRAKTFLYKEPNTTEWIKKFHPNSTFFDIGANIGIYSLYAASLKHKVIAFEPESLNFAALNINIYDNKFNEIMKSYPISISKKSEISNLNLLQFRFGNAQAVFQKESKSKSVFNQGSMSISLDGFIKQTNIIPDYVKIDVPALECNVIEGMKEILNKKIIKSILIEYDELTDRHKIMKNVLEENNYINMKLEHKSPHFIFNLNQS